MTSPAAKRIALRVSEIPRASRAADMVSAQLEGISGIVRSFTRDPYWKPRQSHSVLGASLRRSPAGASLQVETILRRN